MPQEWGDTPLAGTDGLVWFRFAFDLPASAAAAPAELHLGRIDDVDITWVNGVEVGRTNSPSLNRVYHVPANLLKAGRNVVAVRVEDVIVLRGIPGSCFSRPEERARSGCRWPGCGATIRRS